MDGPCVIFLLGVTWMYTVCANRPIYLLTLRCSCVCVHHVSILCLVWRGGRRWGEECHSAHRKGFHPGLIRASAGGDRWLVKRNGDCCCSPRHTGPVFPWLCAPPPHTKTQLCMNINVQDEKLSVFIPVTLSLKYTQQGNTQFIYSRIKSTYPNCFHILIASKQTHTTPGCCFPY